MKHFSSPNRTLKKKSSQTLVQQSLENIGKINYLVNPFVLSIYVPCLFSNLGFLVMSMFILFIPNYIYQQSLQLFLRQNNRSHFLSTKKPFFICQIKTIPNHVFLKHLVSPLDWNGLLCSLDCIHVFHLEANIIEMQSSYSFF